MNWNTAAIIAAGISVWAVSASSFGLEQAAGNIVELAAAIQLCNWLQQFNYVISALITSSGDSSTRTTLRVSMSVCTSKRRALE